MTYEINSFNGTLLTSVDDQTVNGTATDLKLVGRNYSGYGEIQNENFLWLLQNFANSSAPPRAIAGQIWFDSTNQKLKFFDGEKFKAASGPEVSALPPAGLRTGDFWFDTVNEQIKVWNGTEFLLVGPEKAPIYGDTAAQPQVIKDSLGSDQSIIKFTVGSQVIAIVANSNFTINSVVNPITGFSILKKGINFINSDSTSGITSSEHRFWGTTANSDRLGGYLASEYLRSSATLFPTQVSFSDSGYTVGDQKDFRVRILSGNSPTIESTLGQPLIFRISDGEANIKDVAIITGQAVVPGTTEIYDLGTTGVRWREVNAQTVKATTFYGKFVGTVESPQGSQPLTFSNPVTITNDLTINNNSTNITLNLTGSGLIQIKSGARGSINNIDIGAITRGTGAFTTLTANDKLTLTANSAATSTTTGTLVVTGGVGISGEIYVGSNAYFTGTGTLKVPVGTTAQRPVGVKGMIRYNTDVDDWEGFDGFVWRPLSQNYDLDLGLVTGTAESFDDLGGLF